MVRSATARGRSSDGATPEGAPLHGYNPSVATTGENMPTWRSIGAKHRREVFRLANAGQVHSDPAVAAAAYQWSHHERWNRLPYRLPGWLLPALGVLMFGIYLAMQMPSLLLIGPAFVIFCGIMSWLTVAAAATVRAAYSGAAEAPATS